MKKPLQLSKEIIQQFFTCKRADWGTYVIRQQGNTLAQCGKAFKLNLEDLLGFIYEVAGTTINKQGVPPANAKETGKPIDKHPKVEEMSFINNLYFHMLGKEDTAPDCFITWTPKAFLHQDLGKYLC